MKTFTKLSLILCVLVIMGSAFSFSWAIYEDDTVVTGAKLGLCGILMLVAGGCSYALILFNWPRGR